MRTMMKRMCCVLLAVAMCITVVGCGKAEKKEGKNVDMAKLQESLLAADTTLPEMKVITDKDDNADLNFSALSDFDYEGVDAYFYAYAQEGDVQEVAVVKLKEEDDLAEMMDSLHKHVEKRIGTFEQYTPEKVELAEKAVITNEGNYVLFVIATKSGLIQNAFKDAM